MSNSPTTMTVLRTSDIQEHSTYRALRNDLVHLISNGIYTLYCSRHKGNAYILLIDDIIIDDIRLCDAEQDFDDDIDNNPDNIDAYLHEDDCGDR